MNPSEFIPTDSILSIIDWLMIVVVVAIVYFIIEEPMK
jgi:hypothetical protein